MTSNVAVYMKQSEQQALFNLSGQSSCWAIIQLTAKTFKTYMLRSAKRLAGAINYQQPHKNLLVKMNFEPEHLILIENC